jgi:hypothetical protein
MHDPVYLPGFFHQVLDYGFVVLNVARRALQEVPIMLSMKKEFPSVRSWR